MVILTQAVGRISRLSPESVPAESLWFAGKDLPVWIYRVNRRPAGTLFDSPPGDVLPAFAANLKAAGEVRKGGRYQRIWRVGNVESDEQDRSVAGRVGWSRTDVQIANVWDDGAKAWRDEFVSSEVSATAPFWFDATQRYLGVLRHPTFEPKVVSSVLESMLNRAELRLNRSGRPTNVVWGVDPVIDRREFQSWLDSTDVLTGIDFVFLRPNQDAEELFEHLFERIDRLEANKIKESITARDLAAGLSKEGLRNDRESSALIDAAARAYGYIVARGRRGQTKVLFDQRKDLMSETAESVGTTWNSAVQSVRSAVRRVARRLTHG